MKLFRSLAFQIGLVLLAAAVWKMIFIFWAVVPFNSDEAVVALMARHILQGERPVFFYGQAYMGSLDAFLVALGFMLFGQQIWVIRLIQAILYLGTLLTTTWIGKAAFDSSRIGMIAAGLLAVPTVDVMLYTTASLGGYGEALLIGNLILLLALNLARRTIPIPTSRFPWFLVGLWGLLVGGGLWANGLTLVYSAPAGLYLLWSLWTCRRRWLSPFLGAAGTGFFIGSLPWWLYAASNGFNRLVFELFGSAVAVEHEAWLVRTASHLVNFILLGLSAAFGLRPPWEVRWLALPLLPFVLLFWLGVISFSMRQLAKKTPYRNEYALLAGVMGVLAAGFLFTAFGVDPSGRYFLPLAVPLALFAAQAVLHLSHRFPRMGQSTLILIVMVTAYQFWGTLECALRFPPGLTTQFYAPTIIDHRADTALISFLRQEGETRGYSNYWVAYPIAFQSAEQLLFVPRLPYHLDLRYTPRDDRYAPYTAEVAKSPKTAYITTRNPALDQTLKEGLTRLKVTWDEKQIGDYHVYYHLSRAVQPQEMGLGDLRE